MSEPERTPAGDGEKKPKTKVAVLGGGCGSMAAVWGLLQSPRAAEYDITVYQLGWRLGGKGASGRNAEYGDRIEEHGLHIWPGLYENAFAMMRKVYEDVNRPPDAPLSVWFDPAAPNRSAFLPHNYVTLTEFYDGKWQAWNLEVPANDELPGDGTEFPSLTDYVAEALQMLLQIFIGADGLWEVETLMPPFSHGTIRRLLRPWVKSLEDILRGTPGGRDLVKFAHWFDKNSGRALLEAALTAAELLPTNPEAHTPEHYAAITGPLTMFRDGFEAVFHRFLETHPEVRHAYFIVDYACAILRGVLADDILRNGFDYIDDLEFRDWLRTHGATELTLGSPLVRGWYDYVFAYAGGDPGRPCLSAGVGLRTLFRSVLTYKGAFFWKMQAGMGDTIFAPIYEVAKRRGVKFEFFSKVEDISNLVGDVATRDVQSIRIGRQVDLRDAARGYDPLVTVKGLPCWPSKPLYDQIDPKQAARLQAEHVNLESAWADWTPVETYTLQKGKDFDLVILGIAVGALPYISGDLAANSPPFRDAIEKLETVQTQSSQIWLSPTMHELGWHHPMTIGSAYAQPMDTWADMSNLLGRESWQNLGIPPQTLIYLTGPMKDPPVIPPFSDHAFPQRQYTQVRANTITWLSGSMGTFWPDSVRSGSPELDWNLLVTVHGNPAGQARFDQQYIRANIDPSERYVLSLPGTARYRLKSHESGYANLYLAGDWLKTGIDAGSVEAAVMGGFQASRAIGGWPKVIIGDSDRLFDEGTTNR